MRVTANTFPNTLVDQLAQLTVRQNRLQNQAATGQRIQMPEDDPGAMSRVIDLQTEAKSVAQYQENINRLRESAQATYEVMRGLKRVVDHAGEIAVSADDLDSPQDLRDAARQVTELIKEAVQLGNNSFRGSHLLSGTRSSQAPFEIVTGPDGEITGVTYLGNESVAQAEISKGTAISVQTLGANTSGSGPRGLLVESRSGADFFNHLISLQNHLMAGDVAAISATDQPALLLDEENVISHLGQNGALQARLESSLARGENQADTLESLVSREVDADLAQTLVRLSQTQTAYQAALQSGAQLLNNTLLDYLR